MGVLLLCTGKNTGTKAVIIFWYVRMVFVAQKQILFYYCTFKMPVAKAEKPLTGLTGKCRGFG